MQGDFLIKTYIFQKYAGFKTFSTGVDIVSYAEKNRFPGLVNGGFYGSGIVLPFRIGQVIDPSTGLE